MFYQSKMMFWATAALTVLLLAPQADARRGGKMGMGKRLMAELNLTEEQQTQVKAQRQKMRQEMQPVHEQLREKREQLHKLWQAENPDEQAIVAIHAEMDPLRAQIRARRIQFRLEMIKILTPEQRRQFEELKKKRGPRGGRHGKGMRGEGMGRRGEGGFGGGFGGGGGGFGGGDCDFVGDGQ